MGRATANRRWTEMMRFLGAFAMAAVLLIAGLAAEPALARKSGGILRVHQWDSPPSLSIHEEVTIATVVPMMGVFNNLIMYDQHVPQNSLQSIRPRPRHQLVVERRR